MFGIGVGNAPVWCQPYRGIFLAYYNDVIFAVQAPLGDEILLLIVQNLCQDFVTLLKAGNRIHNLMVCCVISGLIQLASQFFHRCMVMIMGMAVFMQMLMIVGMLHPLVGLVVLITLY